MNGLLSLKWNNHSTALLKKLGSLLIKDSYADATIACHGKYFPVHRLVLSTCSAYFEEIFEKTQCKHPFIIVKDIDSGQLEALLNYMYKGEVNVLQELLPGLIKAAEALRIKGLAVPDDSNEDEQISSRDNKRNCSSLSPYPHSKRIRKHEERKHNSNSKHHHSPQKISDRSVEGAANINDVASNSSSKLAESKMNCDTESIDMINVKLEPPDEGEDLAESFPEQLQVTNIEDTETKPVISSYDKTTQDVSELTQEEIESSLSSDVQSDLAQCSAWNRTSSINSNDESSQSHLPSQDEVLKVTLPERQQCQNSSWDKMAQQQRLSSDSLHAEPQTSGTDSASIMKCHWPLCMFIAMEEVTMDFHIRCKHSAGYPIACSLCEYRCNSTYELKMHLGTTHGGEKQFYKCLVCPYKADRFGNLQKHMRVHTGEKPYSCPLCPYKASQTNNLNKHLQTRHNYSTNCSVGLQFPVTE